MNLKDVESSAIELEKKLKIYSQQDHEAAELQADLQPLLNLIKSGRFNTPIQWGQIPGRYRLSEKGLQRYNDLEEAFARFSIEVTGGESPALKLFREDRKKYDI